MSRSASRLVPARPGRPSCRLSGMHRVTPDPDSVSQFFLRGRSETLIDVCPKFRNSTAPVLFHLPGRTISRILESISPGDIAPAFVENGRSKFGLDHSVVVQQLPRWVGSTDTFKASMFLTQLGDLVVKRSDHVPQHLLSDVLHVSGSLAESGLLPGRVATEIVRRILPQCLDKLHLSKSDVFKILYALNRIPIPPSDAIIYPLVANFTTWYLERSRVNSSKRTRQKQLDHSLLLDPS